METITVFGPKHRSQLCLPPLTNLSSAVKISRFTPISFPSKPAKHVCLKATPTPTTVIEKTPTPTFDDRTFTKMAPSEWTDQFHSVSVDVSEMDALRREIEALKPEVVEMLMSPKSVDAVKKRILMIYLLVSLGLGYHFEDEIEEILRGDFEKIDEMMAGEDDLYTVSTIFWVFRTYGYGMSSEVFTRFKEDNGKFKEYLIEDVRGMLSLYEAAHLGTTTDYIMDEALSFASSNLARLANGGICASHLLRFIRNALSLPQHWNMEIIVAVEYIRFYEQEVGQDEILLKLAKLNFNLIQRHYLQEIKILTKWYKDQDLASKLPCYYRETIVEMHVFSIVMFFEPQYSRARIMQTKQFMAEMILDDTCDRYATFPEVESLVNSLRRWAPDEAMDSHPGYLKVVFNYIVGAFQDCEDELRPQGRSYSFEETKEEYKKFVKSNLDLAKLAPAGHVPSFDDYMEVGPTEIGTFVIVASTLMGIDHIDAAKAFDWLKSRSKLLQSLGENVRFMNDLVGFKDDMRRGSVMTGMNCYIKQYGVTEGEARREYQKMITKTAKMMNEEFLKTSDVPRRVMKAAFDCARAGYVAYSFGDGLTFPKGRLTKYMVSLYVNQI